MKELGTVGGLKSLHAGADPGFPVGGVDPFWRGMDFCQRCFSVKMYVKTKELGPVGGIWAAKFCM